MLRTRAMREKEEQREMRKYNYTLLRVRFPDGYILQGKKTCYPFFVRAQKLLRKTCERKSLNDKRARGALDTAGGIKPHKTERGNVSLRTLPISEPSTGLGF